MTQTTIHKSIEQINQAIDQILDEVQDLNKEVIHWQPSVEEWSIMQIVCHVAEAVPYWLTEIETLLVSPGNVWGRGLQDHDRLEAVSNTDTRTMTEVLDELNSIKKQVEITLTKLDEDRLKKEAPSRNPRFGMKPISFIVDHLLVEHVIKHYGQIQRNLVKFIAE